MRNSLRTPPWSATQRIRGGGGGGPATITTASRLLRPLPRGAPAWRIRHGCYSTGTFVILLGVSLLQLRLSLLHHANNVDPRHDHYDAPTQQQSAAVLWSTTLTSSSTRPPMIKPRPQTMADTRDLYTTRQETREGIHEMRNSRVVVLQQYHHDGGDESPALTTAGARPARTRSVEPLSKPCQKCDDKNDDDDDEPLVFPFEQRFYEECVPMMEWQTRSFPNCNALHEASVVDGIVVVSKDDATTTTTTTDEEISLLSLEGSWRSVWKLHQHNTNETLVLKLQRYDREFTPLSFEHHRVDALAMERLTRSPHIVDIFGYCGMSVLTEYATGSARNFVKNRELRSLDRLEIGRDLAQALADVHSIDYPNSTNVTLVHNDMNMANAVEVNGRLKLNDFNIGVLQRWNTTSRKICRAPVRFAAPLWKSPEEIRNVSYVDAAATDVYGLGNLLFHVLTKHQPWTHLEPVKLTPLEAAAKKLAGDMPSVPAKYDPRNTSKIALKALYFTVLECFRTDPQQRPTVHSMARRLDQVAGQLRTKEMKEIAGV